MSDDIATLETMQDNAERAGTLELLARRCETADGPDQDIDSAIALAMGWTLQKMKGDSRPYFREPGVTDWYMRSTCPGFTLSLDAAAALIPDGYDWILERINDGMTIGARVGHNDPDRTSWGETPALALCAAALRSRMPTALPSGQRETEDQRS